MGPSIHIDNLTVKVDGRAILENINTAIPAGSVTAIIGPNGAGKTTLLKVLLGQIRYAGEVSFRNSDGSMAKPKFGYVPQTLDFDRGLPMTALDFLILPLQKGPLWWGRKLRHVATALDNLKLVEASHLAKRQIGKLSGGELQRILLAAALSGKPNLLLLDEPVSGIDISGERLFCDLLDSIHLRQNFTMVIVSHDLSIVSNHADRVICINRGLVCHGSAAEVLTPSNLQAVFGHHTEIVRSHYSAVKRLEKDQKS